MQNIPRIFAPIPNEIAFAKLSLQSKFHEAIVNLSNENVERNVRLGANIHAPGDASEIMAMEKIALDDEEVQKAIKKLQLPEGSVVISDPWIYGRSSL